MRVVFLLVLAGCASASVPAQRPVERPRAESPKPDAHHPPAPPALTTDATETALDEVATVHGAPGPWAVAGWRMSARALARLGLPRGSFDLEVVHRTPREVRYSCIADGAAAHSGASLGKLNLSLADASAEGVETSFRNKRTGQTVILRPTPSFRERYADTPPAKARTLGREVMGLRDSEIFVELSTL